MVAFFMPMNVENKTAKYLELFLLFIIVPALLATTLSVKIKVGSVILALLYVIVIVIKNKTKFNISFKLQKPSKPYLYRVLTMLLLISVLGFVLIHFVNPDLFLKVVKEKPQLWITILFVYAFLSVIPQELIYRGFFYHRYEHLFANKKIFAIINVCCFSWCHLFLNNIWVMLITAIAGILFTYTYEKERNLGWVIIEHSLYGNLVFTLGLGEMLAFPV